LRCHYRRRAALRSGWPGAHLSVGQDDLARDHLDRGRASVEALGNDGYGQMIKDGLDRLADRLA
jgi:hypothetical protein